MFFVVESDFFVHSTADVSDKAKIGSGTKIWHQAQIRENVVIGKNCIISKNVYLDIDVKVGNGVKIQNNVSVYGAIIGDDVFIGPSVTFTNDKYPRAFIWGEHRRAKPIILGKGCSVGADSVLLCEIEIGEYAMIGAGSVVSHNVPAHGLVFGNPAKLAGFVCKCGNRLEKLKIGKDSVSMKCIECGSLTEIPKKDFDLLKK